MGSPKESQGTPSVQIRRMSYFGTPPVMGSQGRAYSPYQQGEYREGVLRSYPT